MARGTLRTSVRNALHGRRSAPPGRLGLLPRRARGSGAAPTYFLLLHEAHEGGPLDLHGLALSVVEGQDEVEEVGFPQVGRRLLLKVSPGQTHPAAAKEAELDGQTGHPPATPLVAPHTRASSTPQTPRGAPSTQTPRAHPTAGLACSRASCPPRGAQGTPLPTRRSAAKVLLGFRAEGRTLESMDSDLTRAAWGERSVAVEEVNPRTRNRAVHGQLGGRGHGNWFPPPPRFSRLCSVGW